MNDHDDSPTPRYFRSLGELHDDEGFRAWAQREFPAMAMELDRRRASGELGRRRFLQLMAASASLAGLGVATGCRRDVHRILPYTDKPSEIVPGVPIYYATTWTLDGQAVGVLAQCREGRPTKLEGNPKHSASLGALPAFAQAEILNLYDPDRSRFPMRDGQPVAIDEIHSMLDAVRQRHLADRGSGLAVLIGRHCSPAIEMLKERLAEAMPESSWTAWSPLPEPTAASADLSDADVIVALDCDPLGTDDVTGRWQRQWASRRDPDSVSGMNRMYVVEPHLTISGMKADHRLEMRASDVPRYAEALMATVGGERASVEGVDPAWLEAVAADLRAHPGRCVVLAGRTQPWPTHEAARAINAALGRTVSTPAPQRSPLDTLVDRLRQGKVQTLLIIDANPVYAASAQDEIAALLADVPTTIHMGCYRDETALACRWHVPMAHWLERWGDAHDAASGTLSPVQPMIDPLLGGQNPLELLARLAGSASDDPYQIVRDSFRRLTGDADFDGRWHRYLHQGIEVDVEWSPMPIDAAPATEPQVGRDPTALELVFAADCSVYDGRYANNGWLQEMPDPVTKLVWDNAAIMSPSTAARLGVEHGGMIAITVGDRCLRIATFVAPGSVEGSIKLPLGYGRLQGGSLAKQAGFDATPLRPGDDRFIGFADHIEPADGRYELATTQEHWSIEQIEDLAGTMRDRAIIRETTLDDYREHPEFAQHMGLHVPHHESIHAVPEFNAAQQWGMTIDLNTCTGCSACVVACQAENNIPIVGKDEVIRGREMHWMRIDRYYEAPTADGDVMGAAVMPMLCQHCELAPCEPVCPVNATVHDEQGLNVMVYNRCVGTRYCSNNCPYKVRRFNFYDYNKGTLRSPGNESAFDGNPSPDPTQGLSLPQIAQPPMQELLKMQKNPDVTVRMRGVMEKCTYCIQRIETTQNRLKAEAGQRPVPAVPDGVLQTACQQTCPSQAIVFGDVRAAETAVSKLKAGPRNYSVLGHLNTRPRTSYLAGVSNPNPSMGTTKGTAVH